MLKNIYIALFSIGASFISIGAMKETNQSAPMSKEQWDTPIENPEVDDPIMNNPSYPMYNEVLAQFLRRRNVLDNKKVTMLHAAAAIGALEWIKQLARDVGTGKFLEYLKQEDSFRRTPQNTALFNQRQDAYIFLRDFRKKYEPVSQQTKPTVEYNCKDCLDSYSNKLG